MNFSERLTSKKDDDRIHQILNDELVRLEAHRDIKQALQATKSDEVIQTHGKEQNEPTNARKDESGRTSSNLSLLPENQEHARATENLAVQSTDVKNHASAKNQTGDENGRQSNKARKWLNLAELAKRALTAEQIKTFRQEWIYQGFILSPSIIGIYADGGEGKSFFIQRFCAWLLDKRLINQVFYFDSDNDIGTLKERKIYELIAPYRGRLNYLTAEDETGTELYDPYTLISELTKDEATDYKNTLLIFDSFQDFFNGNMGADKDLQEIFRDFKSLRARGATIIFLHHQPKQPTNKAENTGQYKGATTFKTKVNELYFFVNRSTETDKEAGRAIVTLEPKKRRNKTEPKAFIVDTLANTITEANFYDYAITDKEALTLEYVLSVINESPQGISQSELIKQTKAKATADGVEILALNAFWAFLKTRTGKDFKAEILDTGKRGQKPTIYRPLKNEYTAVEVVEFKE
ncbi:AAA family ATPase [Campylobacter sp. RM9328]|uniref:AAA family ATPase n=1 Tax=Campylobacter sp. RM9328 TaxID=1705720 RepID=UPI0014741DFC|nr:AAA family ATPase [Campylobacter sp. RM9328]